MLHAVTIHIYIYMYILHIALHGHGHGNQCCVVGVMKMGNIVPRVGIEHTSLVLWASVLTLTPPRFPDVPVY